jgi:hypothetical protein
MIDPHAITCSSQLHDSCGVVFKHEGRIFRALYPRGERIFELLTKDGWMDRLARLGLVRMTQTDFTLPGYEAVIECENINPVIAPMKWSSGMLCDAGKVLCALSQELLTRRLVIWDLKNLSNMAFSSERGPVFLDLGAIHSIEELEHNVLSISKGSLLDQIATSMYVPLWLTLGSPGRFDAAKRLVAYRRRGPEAFDLPAAILRRISFGWAAVPGLWKGARLLRKGYYEEFFRLIAERLGGWSTTLSAQTKLPPEWNEWTGSAGGEQRRVVDLVEQVVGDLSDKICFDLNPAKGYGLSAAEKTNCATYFLTHSESEGNTFFAWRQKKKKPVLPVVCNIWDRSLKTAFALRTSTDVAFILPDVFGAAEVARVPLDFVGQVLSLITRSVAVVGINKQAEPKFPTFLSPPSGSCTPVDFARKVIGKYFRSQELIESPHDKTVLVVFHK